MIGMEVLKMAVSDITFKFWFFFKKKLNMNIYDIFLITYPTKPNLGLFQPL